MTQRLGFCLAALAVSTSWGPPSPHTVKRCGWYDNPTPQNAWLIDRDADWEVSRQGGPEAQGDGPDFNRHQFVSENGAHGYGCACLQGIFAPKSQRVLRITKAWALPLATCRADVALKKKEPCPSHKVQRVSREEGAPADFACLGQVP